MARISLSSRRRWLGIASLGPLLLGGPVYGADRYPTRPIRFVVPFPPGGPLDYLARLLSSRAVPSLGEACVVQNVVGASGLLASRDVVNSPADGYRVLLADVQNLALQSLVQEGNDIRPASDFAPVAGLADMPFVLVARRGLPVASLDDVIRLARGKPGAITYASAGFATPSAMIMRAIQRHFGVELLHVPMAGNSKIVLELAAERIDLAFLLAQSVRGQAFRRVAIASNKEFPGLQGIAPLPPILGLNDDFSSAFAMFGPRGTPEGAISRLAGLARRALTDPGVRADLVTRGFSPAFLDAESLGRRVENISRMWTSLIRER